jgi:hypothetical protein
VELERSSAVQQFAYWHSGKQNISVLQEKSFGTQIARVIEYKAAKNCGNQPDGTIVLRL